MQQRKKIWIDRFQTYLVGRVALYCVLFQAAVWALAMIDRTVSGAIDSIVGSDAAALCYVVGIAGLFVLTGSAMYDAVKFAHKLVGPLYRFRKTIQSITAGGEVELV